MLFGAATKRKTARRDRPVVLRSGRFAAALTRCLSAEAVALGRTQIFLSAEAAREIAAGSAAGRRVLAHELVHCEQYAEHGTVRFLWRYAAAYVSGRRTGLSHDEAYREIPFEREARNAEGTSPALTPRRVVREAKGATERLA